MESNSSTRSDEMKRALVAIRDLRRRVDELESHAPEPIAIVGMACRLPGGADTPEKFWQLLRDGVDATGEIPADRWNVDAFYDPDPEAPGRSYVRRGGFLREPVDRFDPGFFGISPREADAMDPTHRLLLELSWEALENASIPPHTLEGTSAGVFVGMSGSDYDILQRDNVAAINSYRGTGSVASIAAGRISHFLGVHGANIALDTACSSALVALALGVDAIRSGRCEMALAGTAHLILSPEGTIMLCKLRALAADGCCRTFDAAASGYARAEGGGMFVLKKLSAALADGDPVQAVIRGVAVNHDGRASGLTVPNANAQRAVLEAALRDARLTPADVTYVEAHGTATPLGDPIELRAIAAVLGGDRPLMLGSVKTNIGHLEPAAGAASLAKVVLALQHRQIPPHLHLQALTPHVPWADLNLQVPTSLTAWSAPRRIAGISGFGFSGTNAHLLVEEAPPRTPDTRPRRPVELIVLSGRSRQAVCDLATRYAARLEAGGDEIVADLAATSTMGRSALPFRAFAIGADAEELRHALAEIAADGAGRVAQFKGSSTGPLAMVFTGQGAQYPAMARELYDSSPTYRATLERCATILESHLDRPLLPLLLEADQGEHLRQTMYTQPALFAFEFAMAELWRSWGIVPTCVLGHSLGEYVAATVAGIFTLEDVLPLVALRGRLIQHLPAGGRMAAVFTTAERVAAAVADVHGVTVAAINAPNNIVVSGSGDAVAAVLARLAADGVPHKDLEVSHAFHSPLMDPMLDEFERAVAAVPRRAPSIDLISNLTGDVLTAADAIDPARWRRHLREAVQFGPSMANLAARGVRTFLEVGPHPTLCALGAQTVAGTAFGSVRWLPSVRRNVAAWRTLDQSIGELFQSGHEVEWSEWARDFAGRRGSVAPTYAFQRERYWFAEGVADGVADGESARAPGHAVASSSARPLTAAGPIAGHPLLGVALQSPLLDGWVFQASLGPDRPTYLADHKVQDTLVVPGAVFIEMATAGLAEGPRWADAWIHELTIDRPLLLAPTGETTCQVLVSTPVEGESVVRVVSRATDDGEVRWTTHATAKARRHRESPPSPHAPLATLQRTIDQPFAVGELRSRLQSRGLFYGPAFRGLEEVWTGGGEALGFARLPDAFSRDAHAYRVHPCLMDSAFQVLASLGSANGADPDMFLPSGVDDVTVHGALGTACWIHAMPRSGHVEDADQLVADIRLYGEDGTLRASLIGFRARRLRGTLRRRTESALSYDVQWVAAPMPVAPAADLSGAWLILEDVTGVGAVVADALAARGGRSVRVRRGTHAPVSGDVISIDADSAEQWAHVAGVLASRGPLAGVVHCWALDDAPAEDGTAEQWLEHVLDVTAVFPALLRIDALSRAPFGVRVITRGAVGPAHEFSRGAEAGAALDGALRVVQAEYPSLSCRAVDLDPRVARVDADAVLTWLFGESTEDRFAVRDGVVHAPRLERLSTRSTDDRRPLPDSDAYRVEIGRRGTLDALRYVPSIRRAPGADEVEVRVRTTGLNFRDVLNVLGMYPGEAGDPGVEFAGLVVRVGANVSHVAVGDSVIGIGGGTFASYVTGPAAAVSRAPRGLSAVEAATIPLAFLTAEWGLADLAALQPGERVLIHAAAGGVGQAAVHLALARGAEVFATAGSDEKRAHLRAQGVQHVFDSRSATFVEGIRSATNGVGVDVVLNSLSGELVQRSLELLRPGGRFIEIGKSDLMDPVDVASRFAGVRYHAFDLGAILLHQPAVFQSLFERVTARFDAGTLRPIPTRVYQAEAIVEAFRFMAQARHIGKVVVSAGRRYAPDAPLVRADGAYLVTGGAGGVGRVIVEWLVARGAGAVFVNGRSPASDATADWMEQLRAGGATQLFWVAGDVAHHDDAARVLDTVTASGVPLHGVFHAAGVLDDGLLVDLTRERFRHVMAAKVAGAWNLHTMTRRFDLDHFVLFSSIAALLGGPGQGNYAAANAFLDALADSRARQGLAALSVNWGAWADVGMASRLSERDRAGLAERGLGLLHADQAMGALERLLRDGRHRAAVVDMDWRRVTATSRRVPPLLAQLLSNAPASDTSSPSAASAPADRHALDLAELATLDVAEARQRLMAYVCGTLGSVLGLRGKTIDEDDEIAQLGFDSLMAMELRNRIESDVGIVVPVAQLLGSATPAAVGEAMAHAIASSAPASAPASAAANAPARAHDGPKAGWTEGEI